MSRISAAGVFAGRVVREGAGRTPLRQRQTALAESAADTVSAALNFSREDLLALNAGVDAATRTGNALATAGDAIGAIGGLLGNIQSALDVAAQPAERVDTTDEQTRIDHAVSTIDVIASTARFGGEPLLDGSFTVTGPRSSVTIGSFVSSAIGSAPVAGNDAAAEALVSLNTGGANDLASGHLDQASRIVSNALRQVTATQTQITSFFSAIAAPDIGVIQLANNAPEGTSPADQMYLTASRMLDDPTRAASATAHSSPHRVLALLQP